MGGSMSPSNARRSRILVGESTASPYSRVLGRGIDCLVVIAVFYLGNAIIPGIGTLSALVLACLQDALGRGQSIGKRLVGLCVVEDAQGLPCSAKDSFLRNFPFAAAVLCNAIPGFWLINLLVVFPVLCVEAYLLFSLDTGTRVGDVLANTRVMESLEIPTTDAAPGPL